MASTLSLLSIMGKLPRLALPRVDMRQICGLTYVNLFDDNQI